MTDEKHKRGKDSRQDRLKLALRENLKRRKSQARERSQVAQAPANGEPACPDGQVGRPEE
jgi:hypothetical protein